MNMQLFNDSMPTLLHQKAQELFGACGARLQVTPLSGDGSDRRFFRVGDGRRRGIALWAPRKTVQGIDENDSYFLIGGHLRRRALPVPEFLWAAPEKGLFILEDFGDVHLQRIACGRRAALVPVYRRVIKTLLDLHERASRGFLADYCFDTPIYDPPFVIQRELHYFQRAFLEDLLGLDPAGALDLQRDFERLAARAGVSKWVHVIHRDFQSRNLMVHHGRIGLIDFQGMRFGPPAYDLASLLIDPYVKLPEPIQVELMEYYWQGARRFLGISRREFQGSYVAVRLCRNLQILAAYAYLGMARGKPQFLRYIPAAWVRLRTSLLMAGADAYPSLAQSMCDGRVQVLLQKRLGQVLRDNRC
jgi:aminoglycoside/choline kinase family phosphotransferase